MTGTLDDGWYGFAVVGGVLTTGAFGETGAGVPVSGFAGVSGVAGRSSITMTALSAGLSVGDGAAVCGVVGAAALGPGFADATCTGPLVRNAK